MDNNRKDILIETQVLIALFKATVEQTTTLTGRYKQELKKDFNMFQKLGFKMLKSLEKEDLPNSEYLDEISGIYHEINAEIKRNIELKLNEN